MKHLRRTLALSIVLALLCWVVPLAIEQISGYTENGSDFSVHPPAPPSGKHWLGTDDRGRDVALRVFRGAQYSVFFAVFVSILSTALGCSLGVVQGYLGGRWDATGQRATEIWNALPFLYVVLFVLAITPPSLAVLACLWVLFGWIRIAILVRAEALRIRALDHIAAAEASGLSKVRILWKHVLPDSALPALRLFPFTVASAIAGLSALDFLGLGLPPPTPGLGELFRQGKENPHAWWLVVFPLLLLMGWMGALGALGRSADLAHREE